MATKYKSMTDCAYELMSAKKRAIPFVKLWEEVKKATNSADDMIAEFYSNLSLDSRFAQLDDNKWDLKSRRKFAETFVDISKLNLDDEEPEIDDDGEGLVNQEHLED